MPIEQADRKGYRWGRPRPLPVALLTSVTFSSICASCGPADAGHVVPSDTPVVLVVIDTLRADRLSCYDYELPTSPEIDAIAREATQFDAHLTQCNSTFPSLTSILTGLYPKTHRNYLPFAAEGASSDTGGARSLAERFSERGYFTAGIVSHPAFDDLDPGAILLRGWDRFSTITDPIPPEERAAWARGEYTNERALPILEEYLGSESDRPLFLWLHYFDPHTDAPPNVYDPPEKLRNVYLRHHMAALGVEEYTERLARVLPEDRWEWMKRQIEDEDVRARVNLANGRATYDAEVTSVDRAVGEIKRRLEAAGLWDRAFFALIADHGENMGLGGAERERIAFTHNRLFEGVVRTPLIVKLPGQKEGRRAQGLSQNIDLVPTLLQLFDAPYEEALEGESLVPILADSRATVHEFVFSESSDNIERAVKSAEYKLIGQGEEAEPLVYDWRGDPGESEDLRASLEAARQVPLVSALDGFRPIDALRIRLSPMGEPWRAEVSLATARSEIDDVVGAPESALTPDRHGFHWEGVVGAEGHDLVIFPRRRNTEMVWSFRRSDVEGNPLPGELAEHVWFGRKPVNRSTALPLWEPAEGAAPSSARVAIDAAKNGAGLSLRFRREPAEAIDLEFRFREPAYGNRLRLSKSEGFAELVEDKSRVFRTHAAPEGPAGPWLRVHHPQSFDDLLTLVRIDGVWPAADEISLGGKAVAGDSLTVLVPFPLDGRITAALLSGDPGAELPAGSFGLWLESGGAGAEIDTGGMSPELIQQLESMGYLDPTR